MFMEYSIHTPSSFPLKNEFQMSLRDERMDIFLTTIHQRIDKKIEFIEEKNRHNNKEFSDTITLLKYINSNTYSD